MWQSGSLTNPARHAWEPDEPRLKRKRNTGGGLRPRSPNPNQRSSSMPRFLFAPLFALLVAVPVEAKRIAAPPPILRAIKADVVFVGKVTAIEKDTIDAAPFPGDPATCRWSEGRSPSPSR